MVDLVASSTIANEIDLIFKALQAQLVQLGFEEVDIEHIGATAIPGSITKGDVDVLVRVDRNAFERSKSTLVDAGFAAKTDTHFDDALQPFDCPDVNRVSVKGFNSDVSIQLIVRGSRYELFTHFRDALDADACLVQDYNQVKQNAHGLPVAEYRRRKAAFIQRVLSQ